MDSGERPFKGASHEIYSQHLYASPPSLQKRVLGLSVEIEQVVFKALEKQQENRFENVSVFAKALEYAYKATLKDPKLIVVQSTPVQTTVKATSLREKETLAAKVPINIIPSSQISSMQHKVVLNEMAKVPDEEARTVRYAIVKLMSFFQWFTVILETLLGIRFIFKLMGADPNNLLAGFLYALTTIVLVPFDSIVHTESYRFEWSTLIAMVIYLLLFWGIRRFFLILISSE